MKEHVCSVCGYVHQGDIPDDFVCPSSNQPTFYLYVPIKSN